MKFKKDGLIRRIAYNWLPSNRDKVITQVDGCSLFWRTLAALIFVWPLIWLTLAGGWIIRIVGAPIAFLFAMRPAGASWRIRTGVWPVPFEEIEGWPRFDDIRLMPIAVVGVPLGIWFLTIKIYQGVKFVFFTTVYGKAIFALLVAGFLGLILHSILKKHEWWRLLLGFLKAKKERFCPVVTFE